MKKGIFLALISVAFSCFASGTPQVIKRNDSSKKYPTNIYAFGTTALGNKLADN